MKIVPPVSFTAATVLVAVGVFTHPFQLVGLMVLVFLVPATALAYWGASQLKWASVDNENLYVSSWRKEMTVPFEEIDRVWDMSGGYPVFVHLRRPSAFGRRIIFIAPQNPLLMFSSHPIAAELRELVENAINSKGIPTKPCS